MKKYVLFLIGFVWVFQTYARTYYVNINSTSPTPPYTSPATAATNIQAAVDFAHDGDVVLVEMGTYRPSSQIVVSNAISVRGLYGAKSTIVDGGGTHRCFCLSNTVCHISGFTIVNGCNIRYFGGGVNVINADSSVVSECIFKNNIAYGGGGMAWGIANNCLFINNSARKYYDIGGKGGGMFLGKANNCTFIHNLAEGRGGGIYYGVANNCTFTLNTAMSFGGGQAQGSMTNCIAWNNFSTNNINIAQDLFVVQAYYSCASDGVTHGVNGCITNNPLFISSTNVHLQASSPCIGMGNKNYTSIYDMDGELWKIPPSMGCDERSPNIQYVSLFGDNGNNGRSWAKAKRTIQGALNNITSDGTIFVANGTYYPVSEITITKPITIKSAHGASSTIIDGNGTKRCFNLTNVNCRIEGFTIRNGNSGTNFGGGICCVSTNPIVENCVFTNNRARNGAGMYLGRAEKCSFRQNRAQRSGGGMYAGIANNCLFKQNNALYAGGGKAGGRANNCLFLNNYGKYGGGTCWGIINNSSFSGNSSAYGGGMYQGIANNCIVWNNTSTSSGDNLNSTEVHHTCAPDGVTHGVNGCITNNPLFVSLTDLHLRYNSPCIEAGNNSYSSGKDIDGTEWKTPPSMGCDEVYRVQYVSPTGNNTNNGLTWATAKKTIQSAVHLVSPHGAVFVTNGTYHLSSQIWVNKPILIKSINGMNSTIIDGGGAHRCFYLRESACHIEGFTIYNGYSSTLGGGIYCQTTTPIISNCKFTSNYADNDGGGMYKGTANNCIFRNNFTEHGNGAGMYAGVANNCFFILNEIENVGSGAGMYSGAANNCLFIENQSSDKGGAMCLGIANNCIAWENEASDAGNNFYSTQTHHTCAPDGVTHGVDGCITNAPCFVNESTEDYHLKTDSPCVDVGNNAYVVGTTDLDGNVRIINNTVDMGCYERASIDIDHDGIADNWEITYFGSIVNCLPTDDSDNDHQNNLAEYIAGTNPTNAASYFHITSITTKTNQSSITWEPVIQARTYSVFWSGNLTTNFTATSSSLYYPQNTYTDTVHHVEDKGFYRVKVEK